MTDRRVVVADPTFERVDGSTYGLNVRTEPSEAVSRTCSGVVRYNGTVRIPVDDGPWRLVFRHDGEPVTTLRGESNTSPLGGSVRVGQSVSGSDGGANDGNSTA